MSGAEKNKLTEREIREIYYLKRKGRNISFIARLLSINRQTVRYYLRSGTYENHLKLHIYIGLRQTLYSLKKPSRNTTEENGRMYYLGRATIDPKTGREIMPAESMAVGKSYKEYVLEAKQREKNKPR